MKQSRTTNVSYGKTSLILLLALLCSGLATGIYVWFNPVQHKSDTLLLLSIKNIQNNADVPYTLFAAGINPVNNYSEIVKSELFAESIISALNLRDTNTKSVSKGIDSKQVKNSSILHITVRNESKELAESIAEVIPHLLSQMIPSDAEMITVLNKPSESVPVVWDILLTAVLSFIAASLLIFGISLLLRPSIYIIRTPEDVERTLGLKVTGTIPDFSF